MARASPLEWILERVNTRFLSFGLLQPGPAPNNNNEIGVRGCDNEETMSREERGRRAVNGESGKRRRRRRRRRRKEVERAKLEEDSSRRPSRASRRQLFLLENNLGRADRGSVGSKDENVNRLRLFSSPLHSSSLLFSSQPPPHSSPSAAERILKPRDTRPGDEDPCCGTLREITMRGLESGAKRKRKFRWKRMRNPIRVEKGNRRNARVARAIREITS